MKTLRKKMESNKTYRKVIDKSFEEDILTSSERLPQKRLLIRRSPPVDLRILNKITTPWIHESI